MRSPEVFSAREVKGACDISCGEPPLPGSLQGDQTESRVGGRDDHSSAVLRILERGRVGETYLIGADGERSNLQVVTALLGLFGRSEEDIEFVTDRAGHDRRYAIESGKLRTELDWSPRFEDFETGLADTVAWYRDHEDWWRPMKPAGATRTLDHGRGRIS